MTNTDIGTQLIAAIDNEDTDTMRALYAEDAVIWHDFDGIHQTPEDNVQSLVTLRKAVPEIRWIMTRIEPLPSGFLLTYDLTLPKDGGDVKIPSCVIGTIEGDRITKLEEWINAAPLTRHLTPEQLKIIAGG